MRVVIIFQYLLSTQMFNLGCDKMDLVDDVYAFVLHHSLGWDFQSTVRPQWNHYMIYELPKKRFKALGDFMLPKLLLAPAF